MSMAIQRSKYTGDPGIFDFLKKTAQVGLGLAGMLPGVGGIARTISGAIWRPAPGTTTYAQPPISLARMPQIPTAGPGGSQTQRCAPGQVSINNRCWTDDPGAQGRAAAAAARLVCGPGKFKLGGVCVDPSAALPFGDPLFSAVPEMNGMMENGMMAGRPAVSGYHWNKSGYFLKSGEYVPAGSKMVKNRRRNPANPRATSNAITRIKGAKRYAKSLSAISIRKKC